MSEGLSCKSSCETDKRLLYHSHPPLGSSSCSSTTCRNGGSCIETLSGYRCQCRDGYSGKNCNVGMSLFQRSPA